MKTLKKSDIVRKFWKDFFDLYYNDCQNNLHEKIEHSLSSFACDNINLKLFSLVYRDLRLGFEIYLREKVHIKL
jgi:hypothetical protein